MNNEDRYRRTRTDMEDWIDAHKEMCRIWERLKIHAEDQLIPIGNKTAFDLLNELMPIKQRHP